MHWFVRSFLHLVSFKYCWLMRLEGRYGLVDKTHPSCIRPGLKAGHYPTPTVKGMSQGVVRKNTLWLGTDWGVSEPCKNCKNPGLVFMHFWPRYVQDIKNKPELNEQHVEVVCAKKMETNHGNPRFNLESLSHIAATLDLLGKLEPCGQSQSV
jgi:hypothetical protein